MLEFKEFLLEEVLQEGKKTGPSHLEDLPCLKGNQGVEHAATILDDLHTQLSGKTKSHFTAPKAKAHVTQTFDGVPVFFGKHPQKRKFFVAGNPKLPNFTHDDIERNHGDDPHLAMKFHYALDHLPKTAPSKGIYQGDILYDQDSILRGKQYHEFTPNVLTYKIKANSKEGTRAKNAKLGIVVHTAFEGNKMEPSPHVDHSKFKDHPDVYNVVPSLKLDPEKYTTKHRADFTNHLENIKIKYTKMKPETLDSSQAHADNIDQYMNSTVKAGAKPDVEQYIKYLGNRGQKEAAKLKVPGKKQALYQKYANLIQNAQQNKALLKSSFDMHHDLQKAKNTLIDALARNRPDWAYFINKKKIGPSGYTVHHPDSDPVKLVNRKTDMKIESEITKMKKKFNGKG